MKNPTRLVFLCAALVTLGACSSDDNGTAPPAEIQNIEQAADDAAAKITAENADDELKKLKQEVGR